MRVRKKYPPLTLLTRLKNRASKLGVIVTEDGVLDSLVKVWEGTHILVVIDRGIERQAIVIKGRFKKVNK